MRKTLTYATSLLIFALALTVNIARGQSQSSVSRSGESAGPDLSITNLLARTRSHPRTRFSLMPGSTTAATSGPGFSIGPMATGPNLPVLGSGTVGRLTKWTGFTSTNSFIGDSSIVEDKYGNVSIGTGTSTVTVAGTIQASGGTTVAHDSTLTGNGTSGIPLGVALPLVLTGSGGQGVIQVTSQTFLGPGLLAVGGETGPGVSGFGGKGGTLAGGGTGVEAVGGKSDMLSGGFGVFSQGGESGSGDGGIAVLAHGGFSNSSSGGNGILSLG